MLNLTPLGLHHFLARRPLGQPQAIGSLPPLGTSINTIGQTFPVLQLSLEQSERLSQNAAFVDGFTSFQNDDRIPVSSEQRRFDQSSSPRSTPSVSAPTDSKLESTVARESVPEHLNLVSRKPLGAPEALGGLLPLEQVPEQLPLISTAQNPSSPSFPPSEVPELLAATDTVAATPSSTVTQPIQPSIEVENAAASTATNLSESPTHSPQADSITPPAFSTASQVTSVQLQPFDQVEPQALQQETEPFITAVSDGLNERASESEPVSDVSMAQKRNELQTSSASSIPEPVSDVLSPDVSTPKGKRRSTSASSGTDRRCHCCQPSAIGGYAVDRIRSSTL